MNFKRLFINYCEKNKFEVNQSQLIVIDNLTDFYKSNFKNYNFFNIFKEKNKKFGFYLVGDVGVGKTMILNFFLNELKENKTRFHFNEFMIKFHDFIFNCQNKENGIEDFVKDLKNKIQIIYLDEFQVTNIVDAMILGRLFKKIFEAKIKVIFSSNIKINDLYKDGLQRDQFIPFIKILKDYSYERELLIKDDYRSNHNNNLDRFLTPINQSTNFKFNKFFRKITKNKNKSTKILEVKGRKLEIKNFYEKVVKFDFKELCDKNLGSEDYINISNNSEFIFIENLPDFNENNSNQQQRFITLIDIIYEKKIPMMITSQTSLESINSSNNLLVPFKRTISRLYELTSIKYN